MSPSEWADCIQKKQIQPEDIPKYERDQVQVELLQRWLNKSLERKENYLRSKKK